MAQLVRSKRTKMNEDSPNVAEIATEIADNNDTDIFLYNAEVTRSSSRKILDEMRDYRRRTNILLILVTEGGDPDAAYRISRCLQNHYQKVTVLISGYCKSAGTLIALGAHDLVYSDQGEIGPIDVQMSKKDELWEMQSGLTVNAALTALHEKAFLAFEHFFMRIKADSDGAVTLKTATEIAAKLTSGLFAPIYSHIDPLHVGEAGRAMSIARQYGLRLAKVGKNLRRETLERLISGYSTHGFVIDADEASNLFLQVRNTSEAEQRLLNLMGDSGRLPGATPVVDFLSKQKSESKSEDENGRDNVPQQQPECRPGDAPSPTGTGTEGQRDSSTGTESPAS